MKFDPKIDLYLEAATGASETPSHRGKSRFPLAGVSLGAQYRPPLGQSLQCWRPKPGFDIVKQANLHYQPKYSTCRSSSAGCPPEPRLAPACRPEVSVPYISGKALTVHLPWVNVEFLRSNCMDSGVGIQLPCAITMVLLKGIFMKVPYGRARDHRVHHLHHHQHHLGRGPFWVSPICKSIGSMGLVARDMRFFLLNKE